MSNYEVTCLLPDFFLDKNRLHRDCIARKIAGLDGMPGKHLEQKKLAKNANKRKISTLTLIFGKMTWFFCKKKAISNHLDKQLQHKKTAINWVWKSCKVWDGPPNYTILKIIFFIKITRVLPPWRRLGARALERELGRWILIPSSSETK